MYSTPEEWYDVCVEKHKSGNTDEAIEMLNEMLKEYPQYALAHAAVGVLYARKGMFQEAIEHSEKYAELEPEDPFGHTVLSSLYIKLGMREQAEAALFQARDLRVKALRETQNDNG